MLFLGKNGLLRKLTIFEIHKNILAFIIKIRRISFQERKKSLIPGFKLKNKLFFNIGRSFSRQSLNNAVTFLKCN